MNTEIKLPLIDDVGGFPLPNYIKQSEFDVLYWRAYEQIVNEEKSFNDEIKLKIERPIIESFKNKVYSGLDVITYPQHMDMCAQFQEPIDKYEDEPFKIISSKAKVIEIDFLKEFALQYYEQTEKYLKLKLCVTGPLELYQRKMGFSVYKDIALNLAESINHFITNSIPEENYIKIHTVSIDEPSIGLVTFNQISNDDIIDILEKTSGGINNIKGVEDIQIHLHSLNSYHLALQTKNINVLTCEYASNQKNVIPKRELDEYDKYIRVGVCRTNLDSILSQKIDEGIDYKEFEKLENVYKLIDGSERIEKRYLEAVDRYGDRLKYVGPDCGLKTWSNQITAFRLLDRTVQTVKKLRG